MSNHTELRDFRSEGIHFKNKCKFMILKISLMPQIKEAFVWSNVNTISILQYPFQFCSDVSFTGTVFSRNWHLLFDLTYFLPTPWCRVLPEQLTGLQLVKKFPRISRNPKVHYRTHKRTPPVSILGQSNPVHIATSHLLEIHPNIIHPSTPRSPQWSLPSGFPTQTLYYLCLVY